MGASKTENFEENFKAVGKCGRCTILKYQMVKVQCNKIQFSDFIASGWEALYSIKIFPLFIHYLLGMKREMEELFHRKTLLPYGERIVPLSVGNIGQIWWNDMALYWSVIWRP